MNQNTEPDELIYFANYSMSKVLIAWIINAFPCCLIFGVTFSVIQAGDLFLSFVFLVAIFIMIMLFSEAILSKGLFFYKDRVVREYAFGGKVTIYYANAVATAPDKSYSWLLSANTIRQPNKSKKPFLFKAPVFYMTFYFSPWEVDNINRIITYLTAENQSNPKALTVHTLCKSVIS